MANRGFKVLCTPNFAKFKETPYLNKALHHWLEEPQEDHLPSEWYDKAFAKLIKLTHLLKDVDLIDGRLVNISDNSVITNGKLQEKMHIFKSLSRNLIGSSSVQEVLKRNVMTSFVNAKYIPPILFGKKCEREPMTVDCLTKISSFLNVTVQQRKVLRLTVCPQVTQPQIWTGALQEILNGLKFELEFLNHCCPSNGTKMGYQVVATCLKFLDNTTSYDPESTSWMRLAPVKAMDSHASDKWGEVLEMFNDLINSLRYEKEFLLYFSKLELMKEGLYQIKDVLVDKTIGYKEKRHQERLIKKNLTNSLGHSSRCLFTLLLYYLYGSVRDIEIELCGGLYECKRENKITLYMGKILTSDEEKMVRNGVKQLDRALQMFKFVWETAGMKKNLEVQGHLWCIAAESRSLTYRGNAFFVHGISL